MPVLLATLLPLIIQFVPGLIQTVESVFGPKTGATKLTVSTDMLKQITDALAAAGKIPGIPDQAALASIVESVFQQMRSAGTVTAPVAALAATAVPAGRYTFTGTLEAR